MHIITTRPSQAVYVKNPRGGKGKSRNRRSYRGSAPMAYKKNPGLDLVRIFDMPGKIVRKVPVVGPRVAPYVKQGLIAATGVGVTIGAAKLLLPYIPDSVRAGTFALSGMVGGVALGLLTTLTKGKVLSAKSVGVIGGAMFATGVGIDLFRYFILGERGDLSGLAIEDMGAMGPAYDVIPASADDMQGLAVEYGDADLADAYACPDHMSGAEVESALGGFRDWFARFGQSPRAVTRRIGQGSRHAGNEGHRWGWLIKFLSPAKFAELAAMDDESRSAYIASYKQQAAQALAAGAQQPMSGLAIDMQGLAIDSMQGMAAGAAY